MHSGVVSFFVFFFSFLSDEKRTQYVINTAAKKGNNQVKIKKNVNAEVLINNFHVLGF